MKEISVKQTQFKQTDSSYAATKRPDTLENMNIYDAKGGYLGSTRLHSYTEGYFMPAGANNCLTCQEISRDILTTPLRLMGEGGLSIARTLQADGAPPDD